MSTQLYFLNIAVCVNMNISQNVIQIIYMF